MHVKYPHKYAALHCCLSADSRPISHECTVTVSHLPVVTAGNGMQQQQLQEAFTSAQPAMPPLQAPSSQAPQTTLSAQAGLPPLPLHHQSANGPAAHVPFTGPPTSGTAAPSAVPTLTIRQTLTPPASSRTQQPQGTRAKGPIMGVPGGQPADTDNRGSTHQPSPYDDNAQQPMRDSNPNPGMGSLAGGGANSMHTINYLRPEHAQGINGPEAHKTSSGTQAVQPTSAAVAQPEQPQLTQSSSAAAIAPASSAAGVDDQQGARRGVALEMLNKDQLYEMSAAADGADKTVDATRDATDNLVHQSEPANGDVNEADNSKHGLFELQVLDGGQRISHNLLAD